MDMILFVERTISDTTGGGSSGSGTSTFNLIFIVAFAVGIAFLAQYITRRGGRRKK